MNAMKLVTIICESHARKPITELLLEVGARGWTAFPVEGDGSKGPRHADIPETANIQLQVVVRPEVAATLLERLEREYFPRYGMIAYAAEVQVLRQDKF